MLPTTSIGGTTVEEEVIEEFEDDVCVDVIPEANTKLTANTKFTQGKPQCIILCFLEFKDQMVPFHH